MLTLLGASSAWGAGFLLNDHGAKATGRADAVTATVADGSAIFYNPGGVGLVDGYSVYIGANLILPSAEYQGVETVATDTGIAVTPSAYVTAEITDWLRLGFGFNTPFGLRISWPESSPGRAIIREQSLRTFFLSPVVGLNFSQWVPGLTLGGGVDLVPATVTLDRDFLFGTDVGTGSLGGSAFGVGGRVGVMYHPDWLSGLSIGLAWRSQVSLDFEGDGDFDMAAPYRSQLPPDGAISTGITLPQSILAGVAYRILPELELEVDINYIGWSSYDQLEIALPGDVTTVSRKDWEDTIVIRAGLEYEIRSIGLDLRAGYAYDPTPVPADTLDFTLPDIDRHVVSLGASYGLPANMFVDIGVLYVLPGENTTADELFAPVHKGTFKVSALVAALSFGITFGGDDSAPVESEPTAEAEPAETIE